MSRKLTLMALGMLLCALTLELILRILPTSTYSDTGYYIDPLIITYRPGHRFRTSWGWDFSHPVNQRANNLGFLSARDFVPDPLAVALIGDSFVDASMLPEHERVGEQLQRALAARPVYELGGPGSSLLDYAERIRYAANHLGVRDFVLILERGDIKQSYCGSGNIHGPCLDAITGIPTTETRTPPPAMQRYLRHVALLQYVVGQLRFDPVQRVRGMLASEPSPLRLPNAPPVFSDAAAERVLEAFFERVSPLVKGRLILVFDCDRTAINDGGSGDDPQRERVMRRARERGATVVDLAPAFRTYVASTGRHLEVSPQDGHWNRVATRLVAAAIADAL